MYIQYEKGGQKIAIYVSKMKQVVSFDTTVNKEDDQ